MNQNGNKRSLWPYIVVPIAIIVVVGILFALLLPGITGNTRYYGAESVPEYSEGESSLKSPSSHEELYKKLEDYYKSKDTGEFYYLTSGCGGAVPYPAFDEGITTGDFALEESAGSAGGSVNTATDNSTQKDYSDTNIRTEGVMEADIVKTDGNYIYSLRPDNAELTIVDVDDNLKILFKGPIFNDTSYKCNEFYIKGDNLYFTGYCHDYVNGEFRPRTFLLTFDISDRMSPQKTDSYMQDGEYTSTRVIGDKFYLFTNYYAPELNENNYLPYFGGDVILPENIYYGRYLTGINYYCIGAVDLAEPSKCISSKAVLTGNSDLYVSGNTAFILTNDWVTQKRSSYRETNITSLSLNDGSISGKAIGSVEGYLNDSFSVDEYNGYLRLVTTTSGYKEEKAPGFFDTWFNHEMPTYTSTNANNLYILDNDLKQLSSIEGLQKDETIKSARFLNDAVYFVTFRQTDPLFAADLSDPYNPKILDGLKVSGFSNYLHFYSDDRLLGIGYEADENTGIITGAKISMFDISDPFDIKEIDRTVLNNVNTISSDYSYKSVMVEPEKNLIGFATERYYDDFDENMNVNVWGNKAEYHLFSYEEGNGFDEILTHEIYDDKNVYENYIIEDEISIDGVYPERALEEQTRSSSRYEKEEKESLQDILGDEAYILLNTYNIRGLYIDDQFYVVHPGVRISEYNLKRGRLTDEVMIYQNEE